MANFLNVKYVGKPVNERKDFSQFKYCSQKCVRQNISQKSIDKAIMEMESKIMRGGSSSRQIENQTHLETL